MARGLGDRFNRFIGDAHARTASTPDGYGMNAVVPPITAGSMSALRRVVEMSEGASNLLQGGPMIATAAVADVSGSAGLSLVVSLSASGAVATITGDGMVLSLTIGLDGTGTMAVTGTGGLSMIVPFDGTAVIAALTGTADARGNLSLVGEWTPFADLSPENLASAVWSAAASQFDIAGTFGEKLNDAGSASNPWTEVIDSGLTAAEVMRLIVSVTAGNATGLENGLPIFQSIDGTKDRITATYSGGARIVTALDVS